METPTSITSQYLLYNNSKIEYLKFGTGKKLLLAFHGYGDKAKLFLNIKPALEETYTVYSISAPFHGRTEWSQTTFDKKDVLQIIQQVLDIEQKERFSIMGFSMGGRTCFNIYLEKSNSIDRIYLLAPEGIKARHALDTAYYPRWIRYLLYKIVPKPKYIIWFLDTIKFILPTYVYKFAHTNFQNERRFNRAFNTWLSMSNFQHNIQSVIDLLKKNMTPVELFCGKKDLIIPVRIPKWFHEQVPSSTLTIIDSGHLLVNERLNTAMIKQKK